MLRRHPHRAGLLLAALACPRGRAFSPRVPSRRHAARRPGTAVFLEDDIADMIDKELYRERHLQEFENEWMAKNKATVLERLNRDAARIVEEEELREKFRAMQRDKKLADKDPQRYCADRCIATGNCDVYEDLFELQPADVLEFCTNCVLGGEEEECPIPDSFYEVIDEIGYEAGN